MNKAIKKSNKNNRKSLLKIINLVLMILAWSYLYSQIKNHQSFFLQITNLYTELQKNRAILFIVFLFMFMNWILEAKKWQILIKPLAKVNLLAALQSVWIGLSLAAFLPLGNYLGRAKNLSQKNRFASAGVLFVNGGLQFWVTILGGIFGISQFFKLNNVITYSLFAFWILLYFVGLFFYEKWTLVRTRATDEKNKYKIVRQAGTVNKIIIWLQNNLYFVSQYSQKDILKTTFLALLRYLVFMIQIILIFKAVNFSLSINKILIGASLLFAAKSLLPVGGFLVGLSVREATALYFFGSLGEEKVITITFLLWIINIGIPVLVGSVLLLKSKSKAV